MEQPIVSAISHDTSEAKITVREVPDKPGVAAKIFLAVADAGINVDMIVQNTSVEGHTDISFTVPRLDIAVSLAAANRVAQEIEAKQVISDDQIGRVSLVGAGMKSHPGVTAKMFATLANEGINIEMISTSAIRISCVMRQDVVERAVIALHEAFEL